jgi:hypothetical protein
VELVLLQRVGDVLPRTIRSRDLNVVEFDDLGRRNDVFCPVPIRLTKIRSGLYPLRFVTGGIGTSDSFCMLIDDLLFRHVKK